MRSILTITFVVVVLSFGFSQISFAACGGGPTVFICDTSAPNPDPTGIQQQNNPADLTITVLPGAGIDTLIANGGNGGEAIRYGTGSNEITITNANLSSEVDTIEAFTNLGIANIHIENSTLFSLDDVFDLGNVDSNNLIIINSSLTTVGLLGERVVNGGFAVDTVNISGSTLTVEDAEVLEMRGGNDDVILSNTLLKQSGNTDSSIDLGQDNDTLTLFNGVVFEKPEGGRELIDCNDGFDTIVFAMDVPEERLSFFSNQIALATVPDGSITINGLFYDWRDCELLVNELVGVRITRPIPTLSEWGLIAMASIIGIVGIMFVLRRRAAAT